MNPRLAARPCSPRWVATLATGLTPTAYGLCFGATALSLMLSASLGGRWLRRGAPPQRVLRAGVTLLATAGLAAIVLATFAKTMTGTGAVTAVLAPVVLYFFGLGCSGPSAVALAMAPLPAQAGTASASVGFLQMASGALSGYLVTRLGGHGSISALAIALAAMGALAAAAAALCRSQNPG